MYAKFIDETTIEEAPRECYVGQTHFIPPTDEWMTEHGYKPVRFVDPPEQEGYYAVFHWENQDEIILQVWELFPIPSEVTPEEIADALEAIL